MTARDPELLSKTGEQLTLLASERRVAQLRAKQLLPRSSDSTLMLTLGGRHCGRLSRGSLVLCC